jgi:cytochrome b
MTQEAGTTAGTVVRVWDRGVRAGHWLLVLGVAASAYSGFVLGRTWLAWHLAAGVGVMALVFWRVVWGVLGPAPARFAGFVPRPAALLAHLRDLPRRSHARHLGHNPLGALMVLALLAVPAALGVSGAVTLGGMLKQGPLRAFLSYATGRFVLGWHNALAILLLVLIGLHLGGVAFESWRGRENLVRAMFTGDKPAVPQFVPLPPARARPRLAAAIAACGLAVAAAAVVMLAGRPGYGVPPAVPDAMYAEQCGACHLAFPPSLAPAATWDRLLADLQHHFTADATLSADQVAHLRVWLDANAAEHWDTLPAHRLRTPAADGSLRITDTPGWRRLHRRIAPAIFTAAPVYRRSACEECHADAATGRFAPQAIAIPRPAAP